MESPGEPLAGDVLAVGDVEEAIRQCRAVDDQPDRPRRDDGQRRGGDPLVQRGRAEGEKRHQEGDVAQRRRPSAVPLRPRHEREHVQRRRRHAEPESLRHAAPARQRDQSEEIERCLKGDPRRAVERETKEADDVRARRLGRHELAQSMRAGDESQEDQQCGHRL